MVVLHRELENPGDATEKTLRAHMRELSMNIAIFFPHSTTNRTDCEAIV